MASNIPFIDLQTQYKALKTEIDAGIMKVLEHGAYINGPEVAALEKKLAEHIGCKHALACASGTDALVVPLMALGIGQGDEVITTAFSFIATAETIVLAGATPVFIDIEKDTFNMDVSKIEEAITPKTKAIMPVSLYGQVPDMDEINAIAKKHNLHVIEDAAQSYGAKYKTKKSGNLTTATGTSFFPAKPLGGYGDGGAIFTNDDKLALAMKEIREHGSEKRYYHTRLGLNGRLDSIQCAVLLVKLQRYDWEVEQRERIAQNYNKQLSLIGKGLQTPVVRKDRASVWAQYTVTVPNRDAFQKKMTELGVPTSVHYPTIMPDQPWYKEHLPAPKSPLTASRWAAQNVISLPMYPDMTEDIQNRIIDAVKKAL